MSNFDPNALRAAYFDWLSALDLENAIAGTITFNRSYDGQPITEKAAADAVNLFSRMLNYKAYGNKFKKKDQRLVFVAVNEGGREIGQKHPHVHFFGEVPENCSTDEWIDAAHEILKKIRCIGVKQCVVKPVIDDGWLDYMLKLDDKKVYADSVDIMSMWV